MFLYSCFCLTHWAVEKLSFRVQDQPPPLFGPLAAFPTSVSMRQARPLAGITAPREAGRPHSDSFLGATKGGSERGQDLEA